MGHRQHRRPRSRHQIRPGHWHVRARVERFVEPALLLLLRERPHHGYELIERLPEVAGEETRIDVGNLYRLLRALEAEGAGGTRVTRRPFPRRPLRGAAGLSLSSLHHISPAWRNGRVAPIFYESGRPTSVWLRRIATRREAVTDTYTKERQLQQQLT